MSFMQGFHGQNLQCTVDLLELNLLPCAIGWLGSRVVSLLDSGASGPGFRSQPRRFRVTVLGKLRACVYLAAKLVTALLRVARVTADLVESNGSLLPALWLTSPAGWLPRTAICSGTLRWVIEYGLPLPLPHAIMVMQYAQWVAVQCSHRCKKRR